MSANVTNIVGPAGSVRVSCTPCTDYDDMIRVTDSSSAIPGLADSLYLDMLTDRKRNFAYAACLQARVKPGRTNCVR